MTLRRRLDICETEVRRAKRRGPTEWTPEQERLICRVLGVEAGELDRLELSPNPDLVHLSDEELWDIIRGTGSGAAHGRAAN